MSFKSFLYALDAARIEEGLEFTTPDSAEERPQPSPAENRARNAKSMQALMGILGGVQNAPGKKKR